MDEFANRIFTELNKFSENPKSFEKYIQSFKKSLSRVRANDPFIKEIENFICDLNSIKNIPPFELNDTLCNVAQSQLNEFSKDPYEYKNYRSADELAQIVPNHYLKENPVLIADYYDEKPSEELVKILLNKSDHRRLGRKVLCSSDYTQICLAHISKEGDDLMVYVFAKKKNKLSHLRYLKILVKIKIIMIYL